MEWSLLEYISLLVERGVVLVVSPYLNNFVTSHSFNLDNLCVWVNKLL